MLPLLYFKLSDIYTCNLETLVLGFVLIFFFPNSIFGSGNSFSKGQ